MAKQTLYTSHGAAALLDIPNPQGRRGFTPRLIDAALAGRSDLLEALVEELTPVIRARVRRRVGHSRAASRFGDAGWEVEDLIQDTIVHLFDRDGRVLRQWAPERGLSLANFVGLVTERLVAGRLRNRSRSHEVATDDGEVDVLDRRCTRPSAQVEARDSLETLTLQMAARVSELGMRLFRLLFLEERTTDEVQAETGLSADAVYAWRCRLRKRIGELESRLGAEPAIAL